MGYFKSFPLIENYNIQGTENTGIDITKIAVIKKSSKDNKENYIIYNIKDGETPEMLADRMYDDPSMSWIILMFNEIFDVDNEWPMSYTELDEYLTREYGEELYSIREYRTLLTEGVVDESHPSYDRLPVTNYEYESQLNDFKRKIKVPTPNAAREIKKQQRKELTR